MPAALNVNEIWRRIAGKTKVSRSVDAVVQRFIQVFHDHGVQVAQIPRLLPQVGLDALKTPETLLAALTPQVLDQTAHLFGVRSPWLEGVDDRIYEHQSCYKQPEVFFEHLATLRRDAGDFPVRVLATTKRLDHGNSREQLLALVLVERVAELGDKRIERYHVYCDQWDWSYAPCRIQLKAMVRVVYQAIHKPVPLCLTKPGDLQKVIEGRLIPERYLQGCLITDPSLEDYALTVKESAVAKEVDELPAVMGYIEDHNLESLVTDKLRHPQSPCKPSLIPESSAEQPLQAGKTSPTGKRPGNNQDWEQVRTAAKTLWSEDHSLTITDVVKRIKKMRHLRAASYSEGATRKHIAELAPPNIRGKAGRKPKKSS